MALTHSPESRTEAGTTGLLDHPGATADPARHRVPRQARAGAPVLGVTAMAAALVATGLSATAAAAATPAPAPAPALTAPDQDAPTLLDGAADPGLALAARIQQQADHRRTAAEEAARLEAANEAAAKRATQAEAAARAQAEAAAQAAKEQAAQEQAAREQAVKEAAEQAAKAKAAEQAAQADQAKAEQPKAAAQFTARLPLAKYTLTGRYAQAGSHWANLHTGLDFAAAAGTPVGAVSGGTVSSAGWSGAYGYRVIQTLPDGTELWYCHLASIAVTGGQVAPGTVLGKVGATGNVTGPHLHLEVRPGGGAPVDPAAWLAAHGATA
ncbi:M23 family metallopeptidase [Kitasatospora kifunensis]